MKSYLEVLCEKYEVNLFLKLKKDYSSKTLFVLRDTNSIKNLQLLLDSLADSPFYIEIKSIFEDFLVYEEVFKEDSIYLINKYKLRSFSINNIEINDYILILMSSLPFKDEKGSVHKINSPLFKNFFDFYFILTVLSTYEGMLEENLECKIRKTLKLSHLTIKESSNKNYY